MGLPKIELELAVIEGPDAALAYEQREGIFEEMWTTYSLEAAPAGAEIEATTNFAIDVALVGDVLDATVIERQRRAELEAQFDYLAETGDWLASAPRRRPPSARGIGLAVAAAAKGTSGSYDARLDERGAPENFVLRDTIQYINDGGCDGKQRRERDVGAPEYGACPTAMSTNQYVQTRALPTRRQ